MARPRLLGDEQWAALFALSAGERGVLRHCTLNPTTWRWSRPSAALPTGSVPPRSAAPCAIQAALWNPARGRPPPWSPLPERGVGERIVAMELPAVGQQGGHRRHRTCFIDKLP